MAVSQDTSLALESVKQETFTLLVAPALIGVHALGQAARITKEDHHIRRWRPVLASHRAAQPLALVKGDTELLRHAVLTDLKPFAGGNEVDVVHNDFVAAG